ncbi:hypothetical protein BH11CYA1_BH11CYA1_06610 [soil metagenome]
MLASMILSIELAAVFFTLIFSAYWMINKIAQEHTAFVSGSTIKGKSSGFVIGLAIFTVAKCAIVDPLNAFLPADISSATAVNITGLLYFAMGLIAIHSASHLAKNGLRPVTGPAVFCFALFAAAVIFMRLTSVI